MIGAQDSTTILAASVLLGIAATGLSASLSYSLTRKRQLEADQRRLRQDHYLKYVRAVSLNVATGGKPSAVTDTARAYNELLLVAVPDVVQAVKRFAIHTDPSNEQRSSDHAGWLERHNELLGDILLSMRLDLFGRERGIEGPLGSVHFLQVVPDPPADSASH